MESQPANPNNKQEKFRQWEMKLEELRQIPDLDPGIKDTVAALQLMGFDTLQSCEGHQPDDAPHVQMQSMMPDVYEGEHELKQKWRSEKPLKENPTDQEVWSYERGMEGETRHQLEEAGAQYTKEFIVWEENMLANMDKLQELINEFYRESKEYQSSNISINFPWRIPEDGEDPIPKYFANIPDLRFIAEDLDQQHSAFDEIESINDRSKKLMNAFTDFLKEKFFKAD